MKYLVIGAGPCGLAVANALKNENILYCQVEADSDIGGNWLHGVYDSVYTDSCKDVMQFPDFPMPSEYPDFITGRQMLEYLKSYVSYKNLRPNITFNLKVTWIRPVKNNNWQVFFSDNTNEVFYGVIICNGHHWDCVLPELPGRFDGIHIHSKAYKAPSELKDKRVLVIGAGNSAMDIACEAARVGESSVLSIRESPWIFPKAFMGVPLSRNKLKNAPAFIQPLLIWFVIKFSFGKHSNYGLPAPNHKPLEKHPTVSEEIPNYLLHGRVKVKPAIKKVEGKRVYFTDDSQMEFDQIISATGFNLSFPFLPKTLHRVKGRNLECFGYCVYPDYMGLFFMGWPQVRGGIGSLASTFSNVITDLIKVEQINKRPSGEVLQFMGDKPSTTHLYGANAIYKWMSKYPYEKILKASKRMKADHPHVNKVDLSIELKETIIYDTLKVF